MKQPHPTLIKLQKKEKSNKTKPPHAAKYVAGITAIITSTTTTSQSEKNGSST
jgi:hypothetical protein